MVKNILNMFVDLGLMGIFAWAWNYGSINLDKVVNASNSGETIFFVIIFELCGIFSIAFFFKSFKDLWDSLKSYKKELSTNKTK